MSIIDHLSELRCPSCKVQLFRALDPVAGEIVFCSECLAGDVSDMTLAILHDIWMATLD